LGACKSFTQRDLGGKSAGVGEGGKTTKSGRSKKGFSTLERKHFFKNVIEGKEKPEKRKNPGRKRRVGEKE